MLPSIVLFKIICVFHCHTFFVLAEAYVLFYQILYWTYKRQKWEPMFQAGKTKVGDALNGIVKIFSIAVGQHALLLLSRQFYA